MPKPTQTKAPAMPHNPAPQPSIQAASKPTIPLQPKPAPTTIQQPSHPPAKKPSEDVILKPDYPVDVQKPVPAPAVFQKFPQRTWAKPQSEQAKQTQPKPQPQSAQQPTPQPVTAQVEPKAQQTAKSTQVWQLPTRQQVASSPWPQMNRQAQVQRQVQRAAPQKRTSNQQEVIPKSKMNSAQSIKAAKGQFCVNHQWRHAYAICAICTLPYCYVDIMEKDGKMYCLQDIDATETGTSKQQPEVNSLSVLSSVIFIANSVALGIFSYPQATFIVNQIMKAQFMLTSAYYLPLTNLAVVIFGVIAAISIVKRSATTLAFSLGVSMFGLLVVLYEYLLNNSPYLFVSSALLLVSVATVLYSRMSSVNEVLEVGKYAKDVNWPKPEIF
ncbi:MAG: hypothetical protein KGH62_04115 [Candidatus Micrarchaeota archaeon]|nr:hypothetical protein [Candidatus Micrarchaeota archaeon]